MSLEQALAALTAAVEANTAAVSGGDAPKAKATRKAATADTAPAATAPVQPVVTAASAGPAIDLKTVADGFMTLAAKDRASAVKLLAEYGAAKLSDVKADKLAEFKGRVDAILNPVAEQSGTSSLI